MHWFSVIARWSAEQVGRAYSFVAATLMILLWLSVGPLFGWSDSWQLIANSATTVITFLMVFLLQHSQTHDTLALQSKLDEIIRAIDQADNRLIGIEKVDD